MFPQAFVLVSTGYYPHRLLTCTTTQCQYPIISYILYDLRYVCSDESFFFLSLCMSILYGGSALSLFLCVAYFYMFC